MGIPGYAGWIVTLDPSAVATARTELDINSGPIQIGGESSGTGVDWGTAAVTEYLAEQGAWGSTLADFVVPNRTITIPLFLSDDGAVNIEDALSGLRQKVALFQREGGWLKRQRLGGEAMYADIIDATLAIPDAWAETGGVESGVTLVLTALPDFYGDEVTLDSASATGVLHAVLQEDGEPAVIAGDYPARCRIVVTDTSGNDQHGLFWGVRSRHYDAAATAALFYEAEALTPLNGASSATLSGASGGHAVGIVNPPVGAWVPMLVTNISGAALTHKGSYRVRARCYSDTDLPQFRLVWGVGSLAVPETNDPVLLPGTAEFCVLDLGTVRLDAPPVGSQQWIGVVQVLSQQAGTGSIDCLYLEPLDESAGDLTYVPIAPASSVGSKLLAGGGTDDAGVGTVAWSNPGNITLEDGAYASFVGSFVTTSHYLRSSAHGFAIPSGAAIKGIQVDIKRCVNTNIARDSRVRLVKDVSGTATVQATDRADTATNWPIAALAWKTYGAPTDLWGGTWAPADINNAHFGAALSAVTNAPLIAAVDAIRITVYYTLASGFTVAQDAVIYADEALEIRTDGPYRDIASGVYGPVSSDTGDLPRLPPSGMEGRPCELLVKPTRGDLDTLPDSALDSFTVQVRYRPAWMFRP